MKRVYKLSSFVLMITLHTLLVFALSGGSFAPAHAQRKNDDSSLEQPNQLADLSITALARTSNEPQNSGLMSFFVYLPVILSPQGITYDDLPNIPEYVLDSRSWDDPDLTYFFQNGTNDIPNNAEEQAVRDAFALWSNVSSLTFTEVLNAANADIIVRWATGDHGDGSAFNGRNGVLAHAFYPPPNGGALAGDMHFDDDEIWTLNIRPAGGQPIDLTTVAAHEIGHAIGLAHSDDTDALMYAFYGGSMRLLDEDDTNGVQAIYPPPTLPKWHFSSGGVASWEPLASSGVVLNNLRFDDFDGDGKTDVFTRLGGRWQISSGGANQWQPLASSDIPLVNLRFGDFDGDGKADVFTMWGNQWFFSSGGTESWQGLANSDIPLVNLRFGDFDGDGKTDVFSKQDNQWFFSSGGTESWQGLANSNIALENLRFGDFDGDGKTDVFARFN